MHPIFSYLNIHLTIFLRKEAGDQDPAKNTFIGHSGSYANDIDVLLGPGHQNTYVYEKIESEYYRSKIERLE